MVNASRPSFVGPAGMDDRSLCERCDTESHRPLRALDYDDGRRKILCPDCMTSEEQQVAHESLHARAAGIAADLDAVRLRPFNGIEAQDARADAAESGAGLFAPVGPDEELSMTSVRIMPSMVPPGWLLMHLDERTHWGYPGVDGYLASLVKGSDPDLPVVVCDCDWAPGLIHYRLDRDQA
jgi:hypothetical protein